MLDIAQLVAASPEVVKLHFIADAVNANFRRGHGLRETDKSACFLKTR